MKNPGLRPKRYNLTGRLLHWLMAVLLLSTLFIGVAISSSLQWRAQLLSAHLMLGTSIFIFVVIRICNRLRGPSPASPEGLTLVHRYGLAAVHIAFYGLMTMLPLIGWAMLSAGGYPTPSVLGKAHPALVQPDPGLYAALQQTHALLAYAFFALMLLHLAAALFHAWIKRDGIFTRMGFGPSK